MQYLFRLSTDVSPEKLTQKYLANKNNLASNPIEQLEVPLNVLKNFTQRILTDQLTEDEKTLYAMELPILKIFINFCDVIVPNSSVKQYNKNAAQKTIRCFIYQLINKHFIEYACYHPKDRRIYKVTSSNPKNDDQQKTVLRDYNNVSFHFYTTAPDPNNIQNYQEMRPEDCYPAIFGEAMDMSEDILKAIDQEKIEPGFMVEYVNSYDFSHENDIGCLLRRIGAPRKLIKDRVVAKEAPTFEYLLNSITEQISSLDDSVTAYKLVYTHLASSLGTMCTYQDASNKKQQLITRALIDDYMQNILPFDPPSAEVNSAWLISPDYKPFMSAGVDPDLDAMFNAVKTSNLEQIKQLIMRNADFLQKDENGISPFMLAVYKKNPVALDNAPVIDTAKALEIAINEKLFHFVAYLFNNEVNAQIASPAPTVQSITNLVYLGLSIYDNPHRVNNDVNALRWVAESLVPLVNHFPAALPAANLTRQNATRLLAFMMMSRSFCNQANIDYLLSLHANPFEIDGTESAISLAEKTSHNLALRTFLAQAKNNDEKKIAFPLVLKHFPDNSALVEANIHPDIALFTQTNGQPLIELLCKKHRNAAKKLLQSTSMPTARVLPYIVLYLPQEKALLKAYLNQDTDLSMSVTGSETLISFLATNHPDLAKEILTKTKRNPLYYVKKYFPNDSALLGSHINPDADLFANMEGQLMLDFLIKTHPHLAIALIDASSIATKAKILTHVLQHYPNNKALVIAALDARLNLFNLQIGKTSAIEIFANHHPDKAKEYLQKLDVSPPQSHKNLALIIAVKFYPDDLALITNLLGRGADPFVTVNKDSTLFAEIMKNRAYDSILKSFILSTNELLHSDDCQKIAFQVTMERFQNEARIFKHALKCWPQGIFEAMPAGSSSSTTSWFKTLLNIDFDSIMASAEVVLRFQHLPSIEQADLNLLLYHIYTKPRVNQKQLTTLLTAGANPMVACTDSGDSAFTHAIAQENVDDISLFIEKANLVDPVQNAELLQTLRRFPARFEQLFAAFLQNLSCSQNEDAFKQAYPLIKQAVKAYINCEAFRLSTLEAIISLANVSEDLKEKILLLILAQLIKKAASAAELRVINNYLCNTPTMKSFISVKHSQKQPCDSLILEWIQNRLLHLKIVDKTPLDNAANKILQSGYRGWFQKPLVDKINRAATPDIAHNLLEEAQRLAKYKYRLFVPQPEKPRSAREEGLEIKLN